MLSEMNKLAAIFEVNPDKASKWFGDDVFTEGGGSHLREDIIKSPVFILETIMTYAMVHSDELMDEL